MAKRKKRDGQPEAHWRRMVRGQGQNGLSIREFCRRNNLRESAFYFWRRELERRDVARREAKQAPLDPGDVRAGAPTSWSSAFPWPLPLRP
jgi:transposase-like protein